MVIDQIITEVDPSTETGRELYIKISQVAKILIYYLAYDNEPAIYALNRIKELLKTKTKNAQEHENLCIELIELLNRL
ncbi:hypothetical protein AN643_00825 [Candidatus Epulonipiscioides saccharophilum]|nr:hypothetical protein AN643_00825 [Epulopiscium sp. SCG-B10WGA-EpuloB]